MKLKSTKWLSLLATGSLVLGPLFLSTSANAAVLNPKGTSVQMFHWKWKDISKECTNWLGPQGVGAVQVSPPTAAQNGVNWYDIYQPVDYTSLTSKMGNATEFQAMITACHNAGVRVYVDVVANHLSAASGTATNGATYSATTLTYPRFSAADFHPNCAIQDADYGSPGNRNSITSCRLVGLPDLNTGSAYVQGQIKNYLTAMINMGVDGFRFDAAKHIAQADLQAIYSGVAHTSLAGEPLWVTQEIIPDGNVDRNSYLTIGTINEFKYAYAMKAMFRNENGNSISQIRSIMGTPGNWGGTWGFLNSSNATAFVNNWDTERSGDSMNAANKTGAVPNDTIGSKRYDLANILMLAWPYGDVQMHSGFNFTNRDADAPTASPFDAAGNPKINQDWDFVHRWSDISNMVAFRNVTNGQGVDSFTTGTVNQIAFNRGAKGFVAINNEFSAWNATLQTLLPAGTYCNVTRGVLNAAQTDCTGEKITVAANGTVSLSIPANGGSLVPAVALHINQKVSGGGGGTPTCTSVPVTFRVSNANTVLGQNVYVAGNRAELGNWTPSAVNLLTIQGSGANVPWSRTIQLPPSTPIQFKFMKSGAVANVWERNQATGSGNREATTPACGSSLTLDVGAFQF
ncbi:alpha amylase C-terminal domain-containing protein [Undibacterium sp. LX40W]|uniref:Alpha-amylase n=1 Tax=Undibacterium nitidum TaxID=2762298 RepID=A0A923HRA7_9BURK|nr:MULTISPECIES: alpha-amylase family glycosyl hydrolase [Undibacterium]MBC3882636.1 alpha amylase C-terminal domain-containing protein [Undibacterium nitidum]MBC3892917.1 alpha amylase C-terminal domain-containing protein [Undibacterium sp. LX40W]